MVVVDWLQNLMDAAFTEPIVALVAGIGIGAVIGYAISSAGGLGWR